MKRFANILNSIKDIAPYHEKNLYYYDFDPEYDEGDVYSYQLDHSVGRPDEILYDEVNNKIIIIERKKVSEWKHAIGQLMVYNDAIKSEYMFHCDNVKPSIILVIELICESILQDNMPMCNQINNAIYFCTRHNIHLFTYIFDQYKMLNWRLYLTSNRLIELLAQKNIIVNSDNIEDIYKTSTILSIDDITNDDVSTILSMRNIELNHQSYDIKRNEILNRCIDGDIKCIDNMTKIMDFANNPSLFYNRYNTFGQIMTDNIEFPHINTKDNYVSYYKPIKHDKYIYENIPYKLCNITDKNPPTSEKIKYMNYSLYNTNNIRNNISYVINPKTNRLIDINGTTFNKLLKKGFSYDSSKNILYQ